MTTSRQKVYVVMRGVYNDYSLEGVYATLKAAKAANPGKQWTRLKGLLWHNELDWNDAREIWAEVVKG